MYKKLLSLLMLYAALMSPGLYADCDSSGAAREEVSVHCGKTPSATFDDHGNLWIAFVQNEFVYVSQSQDRGKSCLLYTSPSPRDLSTSRMPSSA